MLDEELSIIPSIYFRQIIDPGQVNQLTTPPPNHEWDDWQDWDTWKARPEMSEWFPYYRSGYDEDGLVGESPTDKKSLREANIIFLQKYTYWSLENGTTES